MSSYYATDNESCRSGSIVGRNDQANVRGAPSIEEAERHGRRTTLKHVQQDISVWSSISAFTPLGIGTTLYLQFHFYVLMFVLLIAIFNIPAFVIYNQETPNLMPVPLGCTSSTVAEYNNLTHYGEPLVQANDTSMPILLTSTLLNRPGPPHFYVSLAEVAIGACFIALYVLTDRSQDKIESKVKKTEVTVADCIYKDVCAIVKCNQRSVATCCASTFAWASNEGLLLKQNRTQVLWVTTRSTDSVFVTGLPNHATPEDLSGFFSQWGTVVSIVCLSDTLTSIRKIVRKQKKIHEQIRRHQAYESAPIGILKRAFMDLFIHRFRGLRYWEDRKREQMQTLEKLKEKIDNTKYTGHGFVTFTTEKEALACLRVYNRTRIRQFIDTHICSCFAPPRVDNKYPISVAAAPEDDDVQYKNFNYSPFNRFLRRVVLSPALSAVVILITLCIVTVVKLVSPTEIEFDAVSIAISAGISVAILLGGVLITVLLSRMYYKKMSDDLAVLEKHLTRSGQEASALIRIFLAQLSNSILVIFVVTMLLLPLDWASLSKREVPTLFPDPERCITSGLFLHKSVLTLATAVLPTLQRASLFLQQKIKRKVFSVKCVTQRELNKLYEGEQLNLAEQYAYILLMLYYVAFYSTLIPIIPVIVFGALLLSYLIDKYNFIYIYKRPPKFSAALIQDGALGVVKYAFVVHGLMSVLWFWGNYDHAFNMSRQFLVDNWRELWVFLPPFVMCAAGVLWVVFSTFPIFYMLWKCCDKERVRRRGTNGERYKTEVGRYIAHEDILRPTPSAPKILSQEEALVFNHIWVSEEFKSLASVHSLGSVAVYVDDNSSRFGVTSANGECTDADYGDEDGFDYESGVELDVRKTHENTHGGTPRAGTPNQNRPDSRQSRQNSTSSNLSVIPSYHPDSRPPSPPRSSQPRRHTHSRQPSNSSVSSQPRHSHSRQPSNSSTSSHHHHHSRQPSNSSTNGTPIIASSYRPTHSPMITSSPIPASPYNMYHQTGPSRSGSPLLAASSPYDSPAFPSRHRGMTDSPNVTPLHSSLGMPPPSYITTDDYTRQRSGSMWTGTPPYTSSSLVAGSPGARRSRSIDRPVPPPMGSPLVDYQIRQLRSQSNAPSRQQRSKSIERPDTPPVYSPPSPVYTSSPRQQRSRSTGRPDTPPMMSPLVDPQTRPSPRQQRATSTEKSDASPLYAPPSPAYTSPPRGMDRPVPPPMASSPLVDTPIKAGPTSAAARLAESEMKKLRGSVADSFSALHALLEEHAQQATDPTSHTTTPQPTTPTLLDTIAEDSQSKLQQSRKNSNASDDESHRKELLDLLDEITVTFDEKSDFVQSMSRGNSRQNVGGSENNNNYVVSGMYEDFLNAGNVKTGDQDHDGADAGEKGERNEIGH